MYFYVGCCTLVDIQHYTYVHIYKHINIYIHAYIYTYTYKICEYAHVYTRFYVCLFAVTNVDLDMSGVNSFLPYHAHG